MKYQQVYKPLVLYFIGSYLISIALKLFFSFIPISETVRMIISLFTGLSAVILFFKGIEFSEHYNQIKGLVVAALILIMLVGLQGFVNYISVIDNWVSSEEEMYIYSNISLADNLFIVGILALSLILGLKNSNHQAKI